MTALIFALQPDQTCLAVDTLSLFADDRKPLVFQTKFAVLSHLNMIVVGTGLAQLVGSWTHFVNSSMVVRDVDHVNAFATANLQRLASQCAGTESITTTIYHFGYSDANHCYVGYAYRSTNNWESEALPYGLGVKPPVAVPPTDNIQFPQFLIELMERQRQQDLALPPSERLGIGGDVTFILMSNRSISVSRCHRFDTYESDFEQMCKRLNA